MEPLPRVFSHVVVFLNTFAFSRKPLIFLSEVYLWVVALLEPCDVNSNGRHLGRHLRLYQEQEIRLRPR